MSRKKISTFLNPFVLRGSLILFLLQVSCADPNKVESTVERTTPWMELGVIHFPKSFREREKLVSVAAQESMMTPNLYSTGFVTFDARRVAEVGARIQGRLRSVRKVEGEDVARGEVLAELESVELGKAQAEVLKIRAREEIFRIDAERERKLADAKITAERDAQFASANVLALEAERRAAEKAVQALGGTVEGEIGILPLRSPIAGRVIEQHAKPGATVDPTDKIFVIADLKRVWVELSIFERDVPALRLGDVVDIHLPTLPPQHLTGKITLVSETIDLQTRAAHVRVELDNKEGQLRPGLSVTATIHVTGPKQNHLTVPKQAVTRVDGQPTVFVELTPLAVEPRKVELGAEDQDEVAVTSGLKAGEKVITHGVLALKAEVFR